MKQARNQKCQCDSGKKHKNCCGKIRKIEETIIEATPEAELIKSFPDFEFEMPQHEGPSLLDKDTGEQMPIYVQDGEVTNREEIEEWVKTRNVKGQIK